MGIALSLFAAAVHGQDKPAPGARQRKVVAMRFEGNRRYTDEYLREQVATKVGEEYDPGLLARDERVLREYFTAVTDIEVNDVEGGVELVFHVIDKVVVGQVLFKGLRRVKQGDFEPLVSTRSGRPLLDHALESDRELIERMHHQKGYYFVEVRPYTRETKKPDVEDVIFEVITGERVKVDRVLLEGAHSIKRKELLRIIENSDRYKKQFLGLGKLLNPSYYQRPAIDEDRRKMELYYKREGWLDANVVYEGTRFNEDRNRAIIKYRIEEGRRYRVRSFKVEYADDGQPEEKDRAPLARKSLELLSLLEPGAFYRFEDLNTTRRQISSRLWDHAYALSRVGEDIQPDAETHTVDIRLVIAAGPKVRQGRLRIFGNKYTRDNVIRRQFRKGALPGDPINIEALQAARNRLAETRFFSLARFGDGSRPWGLVRDPSQPEPDIYDVELEVQETDTRSFTIGAGISTDGGAFGQFAVTWRNFDIKRPPARVWDIFDESAFRGGGQRFSISAAPGTTFSTFRIAFADPAVRDSRWSLSTSAFRQVSLFDSYDQITDGIVVRVGRYLDDDYVWNLAVNWSLYQVILSDPDSDAPVNALTVQGSSSIHTVGVTLRRSKRREADAFLNGHISTLGAELLGGPLGADVDAFKLRFEHRAGWRLFRTERGWHRVRVTFGVDWERAFDDTPEVPIFERFFLGGRNLRGFEFREAGPHSNTSPTGGEFRTILSIQYTVPLADRADTGFGLDLVFFIDQGGLVDEFDAWSSDDWRVSVGFGIAVGFGGPNQPPLLIDFGFALRDQEQDGRQVVSVAFERNF